MKPWVWTPKLLRDDAEGDARPAGPIGRAGKRSVRRPREFGLLQPQRRPEPIRIHRVPACVGGEGVE